MQTIKIVLEINGEVKEFWIAAVNETELKEVTTAISVLTEKY